MWGLGLVQKAKCNNLHLVHRFAADTRTSHRLECGNSGEFAACFLTLKGKLAAALACPS